MHRPAFHHVGRCANSRSSGEIRAATGNQAGSFRSSGGSRCERLRNGSCRGPPEVRLATGSRVQMANVVDGELDGVSNVFQVRIHGRGGQGAVTAADLMSIAAFHSGRHSLSFPSFGSERMGAPVAAFVRIDEREIELREPVLNPDMLIVLDSTLLHAIDVFAGLSLDGYVLINSRRSVEALGLRGAVERLPAGHLVCVSATELALKHLKLPKPNTVLLGAAAAMRADLFDEAALARAILEMFPGRVGERNVEAAREAFAMVSANLNVRKEESAAC